MTSRPTEPLREEHRELLPHVEQLRALGDAAVTDAPTLRQLLQDAVSFLRDHLLIHAQAEERVLYPVVAELMGARDATATMSRDHVEVEKLTNEVVDLNRSLAGRAPSDAELLTVRRLAYGLYALLTVHFAKEEEIYLPLLDSRLSPERANAMFEAMEQAAAEARRAS